MIRQARTGRRGVTLIEFLAASSTATIVGGAMILLMTGVRQAYEAHTTFQQLSGYLDVATSTLRNDIWGATSALPQTGDGSCPGNIWLQLNNTAPGADPAIWPITYCFDKSTASNIKLRRQLNSGAQWAVAQHIVEANTTAAVAIPLITLEIWARWTVNGRTYTRQIRDLKYRLQAP